jgi:outer membrane protein assembly factor BamB
MIALLMMAAALAAPPADAWTGFRNDGSSRTIAKSLPLTWSPTENLVWRAPLPGYGQSSPVIWNGRAYLTAIDGPEKETLHVLGFSTKKGDRLWHKSFPATQKGKNNPMMSRAAGTPVVDATGVYALFESGDLVAIAHDGTVLWERHFAKEFGELKNNHGLGSSPAQTDDSVIVLLDHQGPSHLLAIDKRTGQNVWKAERKPRSSWTSPIVVTLGDRRFVVVSNGGTVSVYDAADGKQLFEKDGLVGNAIPSPTADDSTIIVGAGENRMKPDADATARSNCAMKLRPDGSLDVIWSAQRLACGTASPIVAGGHAYFTDKNGIAVCLDAANGEERYRERLDNQQWATPIAAGDRVYFFGKDGVTTVVKTGGAFEKLAVNRLWSAADYEAKKTADRKSLPDSSTGGRGPGAGPPLPKEELDAIRYFAVGPVVYGVAAVEGMFLVRTGTELIAIRAVR